MCGEPEADREVVADVPPVDCFGQFGRGGRGPLQAVRRSAPIRLDSGKIFHNASFSSGGRLSLGRPLSAPKDAFLRRVSLWSFLEVFWGSSGRGGGFLRRLLIYI
jgi:hypothetical protein